MSDMRIWISEKEAIVGDDLWTVMREVDGYIADLFAPRDEALVAAVEESRRAGLPQIQISPVQGKLLQLLTEISGARKVLEIGTLGGYSAIHLARALPEGGKLVSLELKDRHAEVARRNIERAGVSGKIEVRVGEARRLLQEIAEAGEEPFDLVFIDADKEGYPEYLEFALRLTRPGSVIIADNAIRGETVLRGEDEASRSIREFNRRLAEDERLSAVIVPVIRERVDGLAVARVVT